MVRFLFGRIVASENDSAQMGITCQARAIGAIAQERKNRWIMRAAPQRIWVQEELNTKVELRLRTPLAILIVQNSFKL